MKYPLFKVHIPSSDSLSEIQTVFNSGYINEGEQVSILTTKLANFLNVENIVLTNSGTSALTLALTIAGVSFDDEVISISMTCIATNTPIINLGAKIVWADIDPTTGSIDPENVRKQINKRTKAILFVAWAGNPCDLEELVKIGQEFNIPLIQDAAHAFGAEWQGKSIAHYADFTCFSFQAIKHFTTGDGGAIVCKSKSNLELARKLKWFGFDREKVKDTKGEWKGQRWDSDILFGEVGYKFNMNNVAAAIGLSQIKYIDGILEKHQKNANLMLEHLKQEVDLTFLAVPQQAKSANWVLTVLFNDSIEKRNTLVENLNKLGVGAGLVHLPNHPYSAFKSYYRELPGTDEFARRQISLPCGWWLSEQDCIDICKIIQSLLRELRFNV